VILPRQKAQRIATLEDIDCSTVADKKQKERSWQWAESNRRRVGVAGI
jgi:hypothetical protein